MSDSEEEASFASADEGDGEARGSSSQKKSKTPQLEKDKEVDKCGDGKATKIETPASGPKRSQTKGGNQNAKKQNKPRDVKVKASPPATSPVTKAATSSEAKKPAQLVDSTRDKKSVGENDIAQATKSEVAVGKPGIVAEDVSNNANQKSGSQPGIEISAQKTSDSRPASTPLTGSDRVVATQESAAAAIKPAQNSVVVDEPQLETAGIRNHPDIFSPGEQDIPRGQKDHTPAQEEVLKNLAESAPKSSGAGWGWSNWGSSLLSAASSSVQTFTHQVGDGFTTIMETVESSLGVPDPEEVARARGVTEEDPTKDKIQKEDKTRTDETLDSNKTGKEDKETSEDTSEEKSESQDEKREAAKKGTDGWFSGWSVSDLAKKVQDTGKSLASKGHTLMSEGFDAVENLAAGGIDVLENIGKKTYQTLSEHDPALRKTREFLSPKSNKPNLSSMLKEAKDKAEQEAQEVSDKEEANKAHFGTLFDDYQGIVHLEALEMLSNQSEKKVHSLLNALAPEDLARIKPKLISIKEAFTVNEDDTDQPEEQDFSTLVSQHIAELELGTAPDKLNKVHEMVKQWIADFDSHESHESDSIKGIHQKSIQALAELTAKGVEQFHKAGELVLLERDKDKDCTERAHSLARLTGVLCHEIGNLASKFTEILNKMATADSKHAEDVTPLVTNVYLEATNSSTYVQDAFQLLLPVLQHAALEHAIISRQS